MNHKRILSALILLLACAFAAQGQNPTAARRLNYGTALPAGCDPTSGEVFITVKIGGTPAKQYFCSDTNTWTELDATGGTAKQPLDADLTALAALSSSAGLLARTGADAFAVRTLTAPAAGITVSNGTGAAGNPTLALANDLSALEALASTGFAARTGTDTWAQRTITGTTNQVTVTNGDGGSGNPTLALPQSIHSAATPTFSKTTLTGSSTSGELILSRNALDAAGEGMSIRNAPQGVADLGNILFYPATGTNVGTSFFVSPKGTGGPFSIKAQFTIFGSDFVADSTNYEFLTLRADGTAFNLFSSKSGTGTVRPLRLQTSTTGGAVANGGIFISTANLVGIGIDTPTAALDVAADTLRLRVARTPVSASAACNAGDHAWDANYFYICIATNTWRRTAHSTW